MPQILLYMPSHNLFAYIKLTPFILLFSLVLSLGSCKKQMAPAISKLEQNLSWAGPNRGELEKVLEHYRAVDQDTLKHQAANFLITNMESSGHYSGEWIDRFEPFFIRFRSATNDEDILHLKDSIETIIGKPAKAALMFENDLRHFTSAFLISQIDQAFQSWTQTPWSSSISFETFCNYILPYRILNEKTGLWRQKLSDQYRFIYNDPHTPKHMLDFCCAIVESQKAWFKYTELFADYPGKLSLDHILMGQHGDCGEMARLGAYTGRAMGLPVSIDYVPQWGNHEQGHIWNALIINDSTSLPFLGAESRPGDYTDIREGEGKIAKVYRLQQGYNESSFAAIAKTRGILDLPATVKNPRIKDVTELYVPASDIDLMIEGKDGTPVYLALFKKDQWEIVEGTWIQEGHARFKHMGPEVLYLPVFMNGKQIKPAHTPIVKEVFGALRTFETNTKQKKKFILYRKYPIKKFRARIIMGEAIKNCKIEGSTTADFKNPVTLYTIPEPIRSFKNKLIHGYTIRDRTDYAALWEQTDFPSGTSYQYIRLLGKANSTFRVGDLAFFGSDGTPLSGVPIGNTPSPEWAFDGTHGHSLVQEPRQDTISWVGLDFGKPTAISKFKYIPANDRNTVLPDKKYELFYWNDRWISLGIKKSSSFSLEYEGVPSDGIYWLHCIDCENKEERPFTYEQGQQVWW